MPPELQPWLAAAVGQPGWSHYLAFDGDMPVGTGALCVMNAIGWLGIGAVLPSHRNRGGQSALFAARIFARAGIMRPSRPDRVVRALTALHRYGPTLAAGYRGCAD